MRVGGAILRLHLAGVSEHGDEREKLSDREMAVVCAMLCVPGVLPRLDLLRLDNNAIGAAGASELGAAMRSSDALRSVRKLHLQRNRLGDSGLKALVGPLRAGGVPRLTELHLDV